MASEKNSLPLRVLPCSRQDGKVRVSTKTRHRYTPVLIVVLQYPEYVQTFTTTLRIRFIHSSLSTVQVASCVVVDISLQAISLGT